MDLKSNEPFWLIKNGLVNSYPSLKNDDSCDVLLIGGGITGALIAHQMVKEGCNTIVIDRREIANGSTSASTSMLQYEIDVPLHDLSELIGQKGAVLSYEGCTRSIDVLDEICSEIKSKAGFTKKESLYFTTIKKDLPFLRKEFEARSRAGFDVKWLEPREISRKYGIEKTHGGILSAKAASVDAFLLAHELLQFNIQRGLRVYDRTEMKSFKSRRGFNEIMLSSGYIIKAKKVIFCTGYEAATMLREKFVKLKSTFAVISEQNPENIKPLENTLFWNTDEPYLYMRTTNDGRVLIGGGDEDFRDPQRRDELIPRKERSIMRQVNKILPSHEFFPDFRWAGTFGETADGLPYIGTHPDYRNAYFVLGFGGNGITFSVLGMEMASCFMKGKNHALSEYFKFGR